MLVARELSQVTGRLGVPFFLAGAAAREIMLVNLCGKSPGRATADLDFAFAVNDWAEFERLREDLIATQRFERVSQQRLLYADPDRRFKVPVDFVPFGGVASEAQTISWPPRGDLVMNVAGFEEALAAALRIELEPGLIISVASLPGLAILKMVAWVDRHLQNNKDAADLYKILVAYEGAGNEDRIYDQELELLERLGYDLTLAGSHLLGRDAACISNPSAAVQIGNLLDSEAQTDLLIRDMVTTASYAENAPTVARLFDCLRRGYREGRSLSQPT